MTGGDHSANPDPKQDPAKEENVPVAPDDADVLEEDDDFEEFEDDEWVDNNNRTGDENVEWEDNWDDEVEGEDDFARKLRAEIDAHRNKLPTSVAYLARSSQYDSWSSANCFGGKIMIVQKF